MRILLSFILLLFTSVISAQKPVETVIAVKNPASKFQFVYKQNHVAVDDMQYDEAESFANGFAIVLRNNKFSFVDGAGKLIAPLEFDAVRNFCNQLAAVQKEGRWGFINTSGKVVIPLKYTLAFDFTQAAVTAVLENKKWYLLNNKGQISAEPDISICYGFKNGAAKVVKGNREGVMYPTGKITWITSVNKPVKPISWQPDINNLAVPCPDNLGFEYGDFTNWNCFAGQVDSVGTTNVITVTPSAPIPGRHTVYPMSTPSALDPFGLFPTNPPDGSNFAVKLGNTSVGGEAERISYTIHVPLNDTNFSIKYDYAVVFEDPGHTLWTQPRFISRLIDSATNTSIDCASFEYIATSGLPGFIRSTVDTTVMYKSWASVFYSLRGYGGKTLYLEFTTADCVRRGHWGYAYVDVQSTCGSPVMVQYDCLPPNATTLTAPPGFEFYNWWNFDYSVLLGTGQQLNLNPGPALNTVIWVEMIPYSSFGCQDTLKVNINGDFDAVFDNSTALGCAPQTFTFYNRNLPSSSVTWDFGDGNTATGDTVTHTYTIPGNYNVTMDVIMPGGCHGNAIKLITIYPIPSMVKPADQTLCSGSGTATVTFSATPPGSVFNWTNDNPSIGLPASGTGNINSFTAINNGTVPVTATIKVTPVHLTCTGAPETFTITVNPRANVTQPANQFVCGGTSTTAINFTGTVSGTSFTWTNSNPSIGLPASGTGDIPPFTAINAGGTNVVATITVTPDDGICPGTPRSFSITVKPIPDLAQPATLTVCNNNATGAINFTGSLGSTNFSWTNTNPAIGLAASGTGNIASFIAINTGNTPTSGYITVTPDLNGCTGSARSFTINVNPTPDVLQPANQVLCNGESSSIVVFTGNVPATGFTWSNDNPSIGLALNGNGDIPSFTATNTGNVTATANITVYPVAYGCPGASKTFTITVNPTPDLAQPANITVCNNSNISAINFSGTVAGTVYNWTNTNPTIGLAASGTGNIPSFTAVNTGTSPASAFITVTPTANGCTGNARFFTINVNPEPDVVQPANQVLCSNTSTNTVSLTGSVATTSFIWVNDNPSIGLAASGTGDIASFTAINAGNTPAVANISITPMAYGCPGVVKSFTITVNPIPDVVQPANQVLCNTALTTAINFTGAVSGTSFSWTNSNTAIGLAASGTGNIPSFTATNTSNIPVTAIITVSPSANGCTGVSQIFTITVNPTPDVVQPANQVLCNGALTTAINFAGAVSGSGFSWTNSNTAIGLAATGTGNIPSFTATNTTAAPLIATITVSPSANGCTGASQIFTITVNPTPDVVQPASQTLCNAAATAPINFAGSVSGTSFSWTNSNTAIGLGAGGTGNIPSFTATNNTNAPVTATITISPSANGCTGISQIFTITVNPTPDIQQPANQNLCNGVATIPVNFSGAVSGTTFNWTNSNTAIGLAASGTGNIPSFTAINTTNALITATITVTPVANGCPGVAQSFIISVSPTPDVALPASQVLCNGSTTNAIQFTGAVSGTSFAWNNNNTSIGLAANGVGDIPSFTAVNSTNAPVTATISVMPSSNSCPGMAQSFTITVNPTPFVNPQLNQVLCNAETTNAISFTGTVSAANYAWTNDNTSIGLAAAGTGNIPAFTAINSSNAPITATITVTPSANGCTGASHSFTITVNPTPDVLQPASQILCAGFSTNIISLSGSVSGTNFNWTNSEPSIGLASSGTGNILSFGAINNGSTPVAANIVITPVARGCSGLPKAVTITVNPNPSVDAGPDLNLSTGTTVTLNTNIQNGPVANWSWTPATGLSCTNCAAPVLKVTNDVTYTVAITNIYGCTATDNITISTFCRNSQVFVPNAFTPDGDGLNDILMVRGTGIFVKSFRIFNRWGELVFQKANFNPNDKQYGWDGKVRGVPASPDVFVFTAEVVCDNGVNYTYKGNTTLLK